MKKILVLEDEQDIADLLTLHLTDIGAAVTHVADGLRGLNLAVGQPWDLILLDLALPRCGGLEICRQVREVNASTPIIMLTARSAESERVLGLNSGADDYISKPFGIRELLARVNSLFRRVGVQSAATEQAVLKVGNIQMCTANHSVLVAGAPVSLTAKEFDLLQHFLLSPNRVIKRTDLLRDVWGYSHSGYLHTVNSHINRLRAKIEPDPSNPCYICTVWGVGYRMPDSIS